MSSDDKRKRHDELAKEAAGLLKKGETKRALKKYEEALAAFGTLATLLQIGECQLLLNEFKEAADTAARVLRSTPDTAGKRAAESIHARCGAFSPARIAEHKGYDSTQVEQHLAGVMNLKVQDQRSPPSGPAPAPAALPAHEVMSLASSLFNTPTAAAAHDQQPQARLRDLQQPQAVAAGRPFDGQAAAGRIFVNAELTQKLARAGPPVQQLHASASESLTRLQQRVDFLAEQGSAEGLQQLAGDLSALEMRLPGLS